MDDTEYTSEPQSFAGSLHLPIALLGLAFAIYFFSELRSAGKQADALKWQLSGLDRQTEQLSNAKRELGGIIMKNDEVVKQAQQIQGQYTNMFNDLLELSKDDKDAKEIVDKWGIKRTGEQPAAQPAPAAPAAEAAPAAKEESKAPALR